MLNDYRRNIGYSAVAAGLIVVVINAIQGDVVPATIFLALAALLFALVAWWTAPSRGGPHTSHTAAQAAAGDDDVIVYWRPGCVYCDRLKLGLGGARDDVSWVNVLRDPEGADFVRTYHNGNRTVPTVVTGAGELIEASPAAITAQLATAS